MCQLSKIISWLWFYNLRHLDPSRGVFASVVRDKKSVETWDLFCVRSGHTSFPLKANRSISSQRTMDREAIHVNLPPIDLPDALKLETFLCTACPLLWCACIHTHIYLYTLSAHKRWNARERAFHSICILFCFIWIDVKVKAAGEVHIEWSIWISQRQPRKFKIPGWCAARRATALCASHFEWRANYLSANIRFERNNEKEREKRPKTSEIYTHKKCF